METIGERLKRLREAAGFTQEELAKRVGFKSQGGIGNIESGVRGYGAKIVDIARVLNTSPEYLRIEQSGTSIRANTVPGPDIRGRVPLISWVCAGALCESHDNDCTGDAEHWMDCPVPHGPRTYCLEISGDSMDDGGTDAYRDGEIIFVDPDARPDPGRDVVVRTPDNKTTFKRLKEDTEGRYLLGLNGKKIVRVPEDTEFCGVVIFSGRRR